MSIWTRTGGGSGLLARRWFAGSARTARAGLTRWSRRRSGPRRGTPERLELAVALRSERAARTAAADPQDHRGGRGFPEQRGRPLVKATAWPTSQASIAALRRSASIGSIAVAWTSASRPSRKARRGSVGVGGCIAPPWIKRPQLRADDLADALVALDLTGARAGAAPVLRASSAPLACPPPIGLTGSHRAGRSPASGQVMFRSRLNVEARAGRTKRTSRTGPSKTFSNRAPYRRGRVCQPGRNSEVACLHDRSGSRIGCLLGVDDRHQRRHRRNNAADRAHGSGPVGKDQREHIRILVRRADDPASQERERASAKGTGSATRQRPEPWRHGR